MLEVDTREVLPSAYNIITSNRSIGHTMDSAIADIIDNSISANATVIDILSPPKNDNEFIIKICDNGTGMSQNELDVAMTFGSTDALSVRSSNDLGRYGLGLKTASLSQCRILSVVTKKEGKLIGGQWNLDYVEKHNSWAYIVLRETQCLEKTVDTKLGEYESGTVVIWEDFDRIRDSSNSPQSEFIKQLSYTTGQLELIYHRYLSGEVGVQKITISMNGNCLVPNDPFLLDRIPSISETIKIPMKDGIVLVTPHKLLHPNKLFKSELDRLSLGRTLLDTQGFYLYRNKRLIIWGTWFRVAPKLDRTKLTRIQVDIPNTLDHIWALDIKKASALPPESIRSQLKIILDTHSELSVITYKKRASRKVRNEISFWKRSRNPDNEYEYTINQENPIINQFTSTLGDPQKSMFLHILDAISRHLPIAQLQYDLQNDEGIANELHSTTLSENEIYSLIAQYLEFGIDIENVKRITPICYYAELIKKFINKKD